MPTPRSQLVNPDEPGFYHCLSRCVRRAFLCGDGFEHRRDSIRNGLLELSSIYAIDIAAYGILSNHFHTVVRTNPHRAQAWSNLEVVRRWSRLHPASIIAWAKSFKMTGHYDSVRPRGPGSGVTITDEELEDAMATLATRERFVKKLRKRLSSLSDFMQSLKEPIARRANREDGCTGHFWEGRFKSPPLLDDASVLLGMIYVDLNLVRAALASTPE